MIDTEQITKRLKTMEYSAELIFDFTNFSLNDDWNSIHSDFSNEPLVKNWQNNNFTYQQTQNWLNIGLKPIEFNFCAWLRDVKQLDAEQVLNHGNLEQLNQEYFQWWQEQQQTQIEQFPK